MKKKQKTNTNTKTREYVKSEYKLKVVENACLKYYATMKKTSNSVSLSRKSEIPNLREI